MYIERNDTHKNEKSVDVVRKVANHVFVMGSDFFLYDVPSFGGGIFLKRRVQRQQRVEHPLSVLAGRTRVRLAR